MHPIINYNGRHHSAETHLATAQNRSLRYGDGLFETMYWDGKQLRNESYHFDRLFQGLVILGFELPVRFTRSMIKEEIHSLCRLNSKDIVARVRFTVFREDNAGLFPVLNKPGYIIESETVSSMAGAPVSLTVYEADKKSTGLLSNLKTNNYLLNIVALQYARHRGFDDALLLNTEGRICEASSSNLFAVQNGKLFTPALQEGCVAGTKRRELLEKLPALGFVVEQIHMDTGRLLLMDELFLTNAIRGIVSVGRFQEKGYDRTVTDGVVRLLNE